MSIQLLCNTANQGCLWPSLNKWVSCHRRVWAICPYTRVYNEPLRWSVFGFLPPNWAWWARHLIVQPLWESHPSKQPSLTAPVKDFEEQFGKVPHHPFSCYTKTLWGLMCTSLFKLSTFLTLHHYGILITLEILCLPGFQNCWLSQDLSF